MQVKDMLNSRKTTSIHYYAIRGINEAVRKLSIEIHNGRCRREMKKNGVHVQERLIILPLVL